MNQPLPDEQDDLCRDCRDERWWTEYFSGGGPSRNVHFCQGCGRQYLSASKKKLPTCTCGTRWWALYPPDRKKMVFVRKFAEDRA